MFDNIITTIFGISSIVATADFLVALLTRHESAGRKFQNALLVFIAYRTVI